MKQRDLVKMLGVMSEASASLRTAAANASSINDHFMAIRKKDVVELADAIGEWRDALLGLVSGESANIEKEP